MPSFATDPAIAPFWRDAYDLKAHLKDFLGLGCDELDARLALGAATLSKLGNEAFAWNDVETFYESAVGDSYLFDLAAWHLDNQDYIGDTLRLIADRAQGHVVDFGGGVGTHAIAAALSPRVQRVTYCDINPVHVKFVRYRVEKLKLESKINCETSVSYNNNVDCIICLDVLEHLADPVQQLRKFRSWLRASGTLIVNWYFSKGANRDYPFHIDDSQIVEQFFRTIQEEFLEQFHPYLITARCYHPIRS